MYKYCTMCPCYEVKDFKDFCFWYQSWIVDIAKPCGNHFIEKPEFTQEQLEDITFDNIRKEEK